MKRTHRKKKSDRLIVSILIPGFVILGISILFCMVHVLDVRNSYEDRIAVQTRDELEDMARMTQIVTDKTLETLKQAAVLWESAGITPQDEKAREFLARYEEFDDFDDMLYIEKESGRIYTDGQGSIPNLTYEPEDITEPLIYMSENIIMGETCFVCYIAPVYDGDETVGALMGIHSADALLSKEAGSRLDEIGELFLISRKGKIYAQKAEIFDEVSEGEIKRNNTNLFVRMRDGTTDLKSEERLYQAEDNLRNNNYIKEKIVDTSGMTDYLEICSVENLEDVLLVCIYPETVYTKPSQPLVTSSLMVLLVIFCMMLVMMVYLWLKIRQADGRVDTLAFHDMVTGGKNDNYFRNVASNLIWDMDSIPYIIVRFDIASFRYINEAYGHDKADELLKIIVEESGAEFHENESCVRMNADQFVMLAKNDQQFAGRFEKMLSVINNRAREIGIKLQIRLKCGIYQVRREDTDIGVLIDRADVARKTLNGDEKTLMVVYSDKIVKRMYQIEQIESQMDAALENGEFHVFIQPKWDILHDKIYGGEALVRWIKPDGKRVFPDEFIPVFEKNGFIETLDMYMLEEVCKKQRDLINHNKMIYPISVNQSRMLMHNPEYVHQVAKILKRYRIPKGYIELEMTETVFLEERNLMITTMNELKKMDVKLSMDDFGSGYSSLNLLKDIPFDVMKIDKEFFSESTTSTSSILILRKIIEMAEGLGIRVLCEGVETEDQVELLKKLGCCYVQGYYYARPVPVEEFVEKYCYEMADGKVHYDSMYKEESVMKEEQRIKESEELRAKSAVEQFKKSYAVHTEEKKNGTESDEKKLSPAAQRALFMMEKEARHAEQDKLPKDVG